MTAAEIFFAAVFCNNTNLIIKMYLAKKVSGVIVEENMVKIRFKHNFRSDLQK
jgi:hypothetical protein